MPLALKWWFQPGSARRLGISRCLFYLWYWLQFSYYHPGEFAGLPASLWQPVALVQGLGPPEPLWFSVLSCCAHPAFLLASVGLWTRLATLVVAVAAAMPLAWMQCYGFPEFHMMPLVLISWILPWSACADAFSLDARLYPGPKLERHAGCYTWPIRLCWLTLVLPMASAGFHKLLGSWPTEPVATMEWFLRLKFVVHGEMKAQRPWALMAIPLNYPWMLALMAWGTVIFELGCPLALLDRPRFLRPLWIGGLFFMQLVLAVGLLTLKTFPWFGAYLFWIPWGKGQRIPWGEGADQDDGS
jgi:hypothetical protein